MRLDLKNKSALFCEMHQIREASEECLRGMRGFSDHARDDLAQARRINKCFSRAQRVGKKICSAINYEQTVEYLPYREDLRHIANTFIHDCFLYLAYIYRRMNPQPILTDSFDFSGLAKVFDRVEVTRIKERIALTDLPFEVKL